MKTFFKYLIKTLNIILFIIILVTSLLLIRILRETPKINFNTLKKNINVEIYDQDNIKISSSSSIYQSDISINNVNKNVINALLSVEDSNFYQHFGISLSRIAKAFIENIKSKSYLQGASTINQQLIKNLFLTNEKTLSRKIQEISLALKLDYNLTKNQILELYLNNVLFGGNIYGIEAASNYYFNKSSSDLTVVDSALICSMLKAPNYYNPFTNEEICKERRDLVLYLMMQNNYITLDEYDKYIKISISEQLNKTNLTINDSNYANSFLDYLNFYIEDLTNFNDPDKIYTTLDSTIQREVFNIMNNKYNHFPNDEIKCAIVVIDNNTSQIKAMSGNRNNDKRVLNYSNIALQPGSTIKPILDYAPAIEYLNYSPADIIIDEPFMYSNNTSVNNWDNEFLGSITIREALAKSRNIPALKLFLEVGLDNSLNFAKQLNIIPKSEAYESEALGGSSFGYTLLELTSAYTAFANNGIYKETTPINYVSSNNIKFSQNQKQTVAMKPTTAFLINDMLHDVFKNSNYNIDNTYLMAKTGQTNYSQDTLEKYNIPKNGVKDSLVIAYTYDTTIGIWCGYDSYFNYLDYTTKNIPRQIMHDLFTFINPNYVYKQPPSGLVLKQVEIVDDELYLSNSTKSFYDYFLIGSEPTSYYEFNNDIA